MEGLLRTFESILNQELLFEERTGVISNSDRKPLYSINKDHSIKFVGSWLNRRQRWKYILSAYGILNRNSTYTYSLEQLRDYVNYKPIDSTAFNEDVFNAMNELNNIYLEVDKICDSSLIIDSPGNAISLHILHPEATFNISWSVSGTDWTFYVGKLKKNPIYGSESQTKELTRTFNRGTAATHINELIHNYINIKNIQETFGKNEHFKGRYPFLSDYFWKKLNLSSAEYERFAAYVEDKIYVSPLELELELANSRKKNKVKSVMFSAYRIGGEKPVYLYKKDLKNDYSSDEIYFTLR